MMAAVVVSVAAVALLTAGAAAWTGRWRSWSRRFLTADGGIVLALVPTLGLAAAAAALQAAGAISSSSPIGDVLVVPLFAGCVLAVWTPKWLGPRWFRERDERALRPDLSDSVTSLTYAAVSERPAAGRSSAEVAARSHPGGAPVARWRGTWVRGDERGARDGEPFGRPGVVSGRLELFEDGLVFSADGVQDRLRGRPTVLVLDGDRVTGTRTAAAGAGADGRKPRTWRPRSAFRRLVVETSEEAYLFEVQFARRTAAKIDARLGAHGS